MEKLEELKKEAIRFKAGSSLATKISEYKIISALRIKSLVAKRLCIKEEDFSNTFLSLRFIINVVGKKKDFSIERIRLDLVNGDNIEEIAMRYCEPIEVILEIKNRDLKSEKEIVSSKIYTAVELTKVFNKTNTTLLLRNDCLCKISDKSFLETINWWTGEKILSNYNEIINLFSNEGVTIEGKEYIPIVSVSSVLDISGGTTENRLRKGYKIFGIKISIMKLKKQSGSGNNRVYALLSDVLEAKKNKKYYIRYKDVFRYNAFTPGIHERLKRLYRDRFSKEIGFLDCYIKKENLNNFIELSKEFGYYKDEVMVRQ